MNAGAVNHRLRLYAFRFARFENQCLFSPFQTSHHLSIMPKKITTVNGVTPFPMRYVYKTRPVARVDDVMREFDRHVGFVIAHQSRKVASLLRHDQPQKMQLQDPEVFKKSVNRMHKREPPVFLNTI